MILPTTWALVIAADAAVVVTVAIGRSQKAFDSEDAAERQAAARRLRILGKVALAQAVVVLGAAALNILLEKTRFDTIDAMYGPEEPIPGLHSALYYTVRDCSFLAAAFIVLPIVAWIYLRRRAAKLDPAR